MATDPDCLFCKIVAGDVAAEVVARREGVVAFRDINPQAPTHVLIVPEEHLASLAEVTEGHGELLTTLVGVANEVARDEGVAGGFRVVANTGRAAGQSVDHLHLHVLGGRSFGWPPG